MAAFVAALLQLAADRAWAFYNPQVGRWLNRDPIAERGGLNLYAFVKNNPIQWVDPSGEDPKSCCECGPDVTAPLKQTLENIRGTFKTGISDASRTSACLTIVGAGTGGITAAQGAWDIRQLFEYSQGTNGCTDCRNTVAFEGKCYYAGQVNFAMWGLMFKLCSEWMNKGYTEQDAHDFVTIWKGNEYGQGADNVFVQQAQAFTAYGYTGTGSLAGALSHCPLSKLKWKAFSFDWAWEPFKPVSTWK